MGNNMFFLFLLLTIKYNLMKDTNIYTAISLFLIMITSCTLEDKHDNTSISNIKAESKINEFNLEQTLLEINSKYLNSLPIDKNPLFSDAHKDRWWLVVGADIGGAWMGARVGGRLGAFFGPKGAAVGAGFGAVIVAAAASQGMYELTSYQVATSDLDNNEKHLLNPLCDSELKTEVGLRHNQLLFNSVKKDLSLINLSTQYSLREEKNILTNDFGMTDEEINFYQKNKRELLEEIIFIKNASKEINFLEIILKHTNEESQNLTHKIMDIFFSGMKNDHFEKKDFKKYISEYIKFSNTLYSNNKITTNEHFTLLSNFDVALYSFYFWNLLIFNHHD